MRKSQKHMNNLQVDYLIPLTLPISLLVNTISFFNHTLHFELTLWMFSISNTIIDLWTKIVPTFSQK